MARLIRRISFKSNANLFANVLGIFSSVPKLNFILVPYCNLTNKCQTLKREMGRFGLGAQVHEAFNNINYF